MTAADQPEDNDKDKDKDDDKDNYNVKENYKDQDYDKDKDKDKDKDHTEDKYLTCRMNAAITCLFIKVKLEDITARYLMIRTKLHI